MDWKLFLLLLCFAFAAFVLFPWGIVFWFIKDLIPPKPPSTREGEKIRICGFKYSTKEDIDKRRDEIKDVEF